jgi:hypothetical protein
MKKKKPTINMYKDVYLTIKKMRKYLNENLENKKNIYDQENEEKKLRNYLKNDMITIDFVDLEVYDKYILWGGTINNTLQFAYKVTESNKNSGVEFHYLEGFDPNDEENDDIIEKLELYYDIFFKYWRDEVITD